MPDANAIAAVDASFAAFGKAAGYVPPTGGAAIPCVIIIHQRTGSPEEYAGRPRTSGILVDVRVTEVAQPLANGVFTVTESGRKLAVAGKPVLDESEQYVWTCEAA